MAIIRELTADDWREWRALRLTALAEAPHAFGARLEEWQGAGDTEARWRKRLTDRPFTVLAEIGGRATGMASGSAPDETATVALHSMYVAASARGHGIGDALIEAVTGWARRSGARRLRLEVFDDNQSAIALYRRHGFTRAGTVRYPRLALEMVREVRYPSPPA
ncbi:GNAT family N-acetyltransferase [Amycolatopsis sp. PS_44_ISF1]|uniref:GNAT family N-acetyltransferase n=1 Tax=Amycolatopsis sp. PS_44_ISF1 TaxID=2974917 RepID=UPI0028DD623B|nr:GNAT family N-acetyltransferase [Amycolatopsis sp. PS_44_ISF1]MDT8914927.1 GNAT family N-acetyltransferase [Amycolatopsis sp. PS_44_ISF1]